MASQAHVNSITSVGDPKHPEGSQLGVTPRAVGRVLGCFHFFIVFCLWDAGPI